MPLLHQLSGEGLEPGRLFLLDVWLYWRSKWSLSVCSCQYCRGREGDSAAAAVVSGAAADGVAGASNGSSSMVMLRIS